MYSIDRSWYGQSSGQSSIVDWSTFMVPSIVVEPYYRKRLPLADATRYLFCAWHIDSNGARAGVEPTSCTGLVLGKASYECLLALPIELLVHVVAYTATALSYVGHLVRTCDLRP